VTLAEIGDKAQLLRRMFAACRRARCPIVVGIPLPPCSTAPLLAPDGGAQVH
jgi:putative Ca2+/H+ antiporter (TMEM165/GDT1 family)